MVPGSAWAHPSVVPAAAFSVDRALQLLGPFVTLGMTHIWLGFDHLLFLLAVVLLVVSWATLALGGVWAIQRMAH